MRLYYAPNACSFGIHVILEEIGRPYEAVAVDFRNNAQYAPEYVAINPKSKVPALVRDDGSLLTEFPVIAMWLAKSNPWSGLVPADLEGETRCAEMLDYICGTVHPQAFTRQFRPNRFTPTEADIPKIVEEGKRYAIRYFDTIEQGWRGGDWVLPSGYSVADAALFFVEYWAVKRSGMDLPPRLANHFSKMMARPAVARALDAEGMPR
ncbi:MAG TPA: glutathione S-transferase N-terminal domain-containing protein [Acetobacteraceae bacterium]|nr:glutathione S-transferase N-terminal domain-containing protein [Acetobacteraceae bacterium]